MSKLTLIVISASLLGFALLVLAQAYQIQDILNRRCTNVVEVKRIVEASPSATVTVTTPKTSTRSAN